MNPRSLPSCLSSAAFVSPIRIYPHSLVAYSSRPECHCSSRTLRSTPAARPFHSSRHLLQDATAGSQNHYETLNVPFSANASDIKKSFYKLSKAHHPDHNPQDPHAPRRFMRISEAYAVLSHTEKRAAYDRDVMRQHSHRHLRGQHRPNASYYSTGPAGGRPASGLSRRRSAFRGPPPSFYRNTGSGQNTAHNTAGHASQSSRTGGSTANAGQDYGPTGFGPGNVNADDAGTRSNPSTPHFNWDKTERTHRNISERVAERRAAAAHSAAYHDETSMVVGFLIMTAALAAGILVPVILFNDWRQEKKTSPAKPKT
ncbi:heat shock protein DNAj [Sporothrix brasiliensis 5110]|uniref:Heat shock protein DNAj n=1 Tax=Sporothrix brasiliensis 5110 TaxID=1398154 RepID=A0A0C2IP28_9PEZI|nr:heat shock protein DNAj [Sporothrix brasiliensis 5110]KIH86837.1 heat shock protein DNAj [Sporothrix brasiliensis 5110]